MTGRENDAAEAPQFLRCAGMSAAAKAIFDEDISKMGFVMNVSRLWAHGPEAMAALFELMRVVTSSRPFTGPELAAGILRGDDSGLTAPEQTMAAWARRIARDPNGTSAADVAELRQAGFSDSGIFAMTVFVALRVAFSTVNNALGVLPDAAYRSTAPAAVLDSVTYGRPIDGGPLSGS